MPALRPCLPLNTRMICVLAMQQCMMNLQSPCIRYSFLHVLKKITASEPKHYSDSSTLHHVYNTGKQEPGFWRIVQRNENLLFLQHKGWLSGLVLNGAKLPFLTNIKPYRNLQKQAFTLTEYKCCHCFAFTHGLLYVLNVVI